MLHGSMFNSVDRLQMEKPRSSSFSTEIELSMSCMWSETSICSGGYILYLRSYRVDGMGSRSPVHSYLWSNISYIEFFSVKVISGTNCDLQKKYERH